MPLKWISNDVLNDLKNAGYSSGRIQKEHLLSGSTLVKLKAGVGVSWENIERICAMLNCQPGDILEYVPDTVPPD